MLKIIGKLLKILIIAGIFLTIFWFSCFKGSESKQITPSIFLWANKLYSQLYTHPLSHDLIQGLVAIHSEDYFTAIDLCKKAAEQEPHNRAAAICYIRSLLLSGNYTEANQQLTAYQKQFGIDERYQIEQARYLSLTDKYDEASAILEGQLQKDPSNDLLLDIKQFMSTHTQNPNKGL